MDDRVKICEICGAAFVGGGRGNIRRICRDENCRRKRNRRLHRAWENKRKERRRRAAQRHPRGRRVRNAETDLEQEKRIAFHAERVRAEIKILHRHGLSCQCSCFMADQVLKL